MVLNSCLREERLDSHAELGVLAAQMPQASLILAVFQAKNGYTTGAIQIDILARNHHLQVTCK